MILFSIKFNNGSVVMLCLQSKPPPAGRRPENNQSRDHRVNQLVAAEAQRRHQAVKGLLSRRSHIPREDEWQEREGGLRGVLF